MADIPNGSGTGKPMTIEDILALIRSGEAELGRFDPRIPQLDANRAFQPPGSKFSNQALPILPTRVIAPEPRIAESISMPPIPPRRPAEFNMAPPADDSVAQPQAAPVTINRAPRPQMTASPAPADDTVSRALWAAYNESESPADFLRADAATREGRAGGGHVLSDDYPTSYMPNVGRQVMAGGGEAEDDYQSPRSRVRAALDLVQNQMAPQADGEGFQRALQNYRNFPQQQGEAAARPLNLDARDVIGGAIAGAPQRGDSSYMNEIRRRAADALFGSTGLPGSGTLGFGIADAPLVTGLPLMASDIAGSAGRGDYAEAALGAALPAAFYARQPIGKALGAARDALGRVPAPVAAGATAAAVMSPEEVEAAKAKALVQRIMRAGVGHNGGPPMQTLYSDLSKNKHVIPVEEMSAGYVPTHQMLPRKIIDPQKLQGSELVNAVGDRTMAGQNLVEINGVPLAYPVSLEGGPDFMRALANQRQGAVWASDPAVIKSIAKFGKGRADETGKDVNFVYSSMGARAGDFSHMMSDAILAQMQGRPFSKDALEALNKVMSQRNSKWPGLPNTDEEAIQRARDVILSNGPMRKQFAEEVALGNLQGMGFPDIGSTRYAITEPAMIGKPTGASGYAISRLDPAGSWTNKPEVPHTTYPSQMIGGKYKGGLELQVPREIMFPDFYKQRRLEGRPQGSDDRSFSLSRVSQDANQEWLDNLMKWTERSRRSID